MLKAVAVFIEGGGGSVNSVTGLNTNNADPANPVIRISVDGVTITGLGTPASPLVAAGGSGSPGGATDSIQFNAGSGLFGGIILTAGEVLIGQTSGAPVATTVFNAAGTALAAGVLGSSLASLGTLTSELIVECGQNDQALFKAAATFNTNINIDTTTASRQATYTFLDAGAGKWTFGKDTDDSFFFYDYVFGGLALRFFNGAITNGIWNGSVIDPAYLSVATAAAEGIVKPDNTTITISAGVISAIGGNPKMGNFYWAVPSATTIILIPYSVYAFTINELYGLATTSGSIVITIKINGTAVTGLNTVTANSTPQNVPATSANSVNIGDQVSIVLTSNSSASGLIFTMKGTE